jgi:3-phosphoshikimate 1-carboxyvinyltransferase
VDEDGLHDIDHVDSTRQLESDPVLGGSRHPGAGGWYHPGPVPVRLSPASGIHGRYHLPGDKSLSHRLAMLAAAGTGPSRLAGFSTARDCASTLECLGRLGVPWRMEEGALHVPGNGIDAWRPPVVPLDAGNSGSTLRMLLGLLAGRPFSATLTGDTSLRRRPMERVAVPLRAMGATVTTRDGHAPVGVRGGRLRGGIHRLEVASAQVKTAVLFAGLQADGPITVVEPAPSRDHTERLLPLLGVRLEVDGGAATVWPAPVLQPLDVTVPGDPSSGAFLVVAALLLPDSQVILERVLLNPRRTRYLEVLRRMGADIEVEPAGDHPEPWGRLIARTSRLGQAVVTADEAPALVDELPALAVAATRAEGALVVEGAGELRLKESDRIAALAAGLGALGAAVEERADGFVVRGGRPLRGARVSACGDHRIAMALAVAALTAEGDTRIEGAESAAVSFPGFFDLLEQAVRA